MQQYGYVGSVGAVGRDSGVKLGNFVALMLLALVLANPPIGAQTLDASTSDSTIGNSRGCKPTPTPRECRSFALTNLGAYSSFDHSGFHSPELQFVTDLGFLVNFGAQSAFGGSFYVSAGQDLLTGGPMLRYRRWLNGPRSLDFGVGVGVIHDSRHNVSMMGLVKFNMNEQLGFALRPEYLKVERTYCSSFVCEREIAAVPRVSVGLEVGGRTGRKVFGVLAVAAVMAAVAALLSFNSITIP